MNHIGLNPFLHQQMLDKGYTLTRRNGLEHYVDQAGTYVPFPPGFITGPSLTGNGDQTLSLKNLSGSWLQYNTKPQDSARLLRFLLAKQREIVQAQQQKTEICA